MGNRGQCTSFYNEKSEHLAEPLVKCLLQNNQPVPDFLNEFRPQGNDVEWDDSSDVGDADDIAVTLHDVDLGDVDEQLVAYLESGGVSTSA